jgi:hypothetical protein
MKLLFVILIILSLSCSTALLIKEFKTVQSWQEKGLKIYHEQLDCFSAWKTKIKPSKQQWLTTNPLFIALKCWIELFANLISLAIMVGSSIGYYRKVKT